MVCLECVVARETNTKSGSIGYQYRVHGLYISVLQEPVQGVESVRLLLGVRCKTDKIHIRAALYLAHQSGEKQQLALFTYTDFAENTIT